MRRNWQLSYRQSAPIWSVWFGTCSNWYNLDSTCCFDIDRYWRMNTLSATELPSRFVFAISHSRVKSLQLGCLHYCQQSNLCYLSCTQLLSCHRSWVRPCWVWTASGVVRVWIYLGCSTMEVCSSPSGACPYAQCKCQLVLFHHEIRIHPVVFKSIVWTLFRFQLGRLIFNDISMRGFWLTRWQQQHTRQERVQMVSSSTISDFVSNRQHASYCRWMSS